MHPQASSHALTYAHALSSPKKTTRSDTPGSPLIKRKASALGQQLVLQAGSRVFAGTSNAHHAAAVAAAQPGPSHHNKRKTHDGPALKTPDKRAMLSTHNLPAISDLIGTLGHTLDSSCSPSKMTPLTRRGIKLSGLLITPKKVHDDHEAGSTDTRSIMTQINNLRHVVGRTGSNSQGTLQHSFGTLVNELLQIMQNKPELFRTALVHTPALSHLQLYDLNTLPPSARNRISQQLIALNMSPKGVNTVLSQHPSKPDQKAFDQFKIVVKKNGTAETLGKNLATASIGLNLKSPTGGPATHTSTIHLVTGSGWRIPTGKNGAQATHLTLQLPHHEKLSAPALSTAPWKPASNAGDPSLRQFIELTRKLLQPHTTELAFTLTAPDVLEENSYWALFESQNAPPQPEPTPTLPSIHQGHERRLDTEQQIGAFLLNLQTALAFSGIEAEFTHLDIVSRLPVCNSCGLYLGLLGHLPQLKGLQISVLQLDSQQNHVQPS